MPTIFLLFAILFDPIFLDLQEIAEPLSDLKEGIAALQGSKTFKYILSVLLSIGNFLNGAAVRKTQPFCFPAWCHESSRCIMLSEHHCVADALSLFRHPVFTSTTCPKCQKSRTQFTNTRYCITCASL